MCLPLYRITKIAISKKFKYSRWPFWMFYFSNFQISWKMVRGLNPFRLLQLLKQNITELTFEGSSSGSLGLEQVCLVWICVVTVLLLLLLYCNGCFWCGLTIWSQFLFINIVYHTTSISVLSSEARLFSFEFIDSTLFENPYNP